jgi:hypothetical protein
LIARILVLAITLLIGLNGIAGGYAAMSNPDAPFGIPASVLKNGPFNDFLVPGIVLFFVVGIGNLATAYLLLKKARPQPYILALMSGITIGWIVVQIYAMEEINALHAIIFSLAAIQSGYAVYLLMRDDRFPFNAI